MSALGSTLCHTSNGIISPVISTRGPYLEFGLSYIASFSLQVFQLLLDFFTCLVYLHQVTLELSRKEVIRLGPPSSEQSF